MKTFTFFVVGNPRTKGSKSLMRTNGGRYIMIEAGGNKLKKWMRSVKVKALLTFKEPIEGAIRIDCCFQFRRPKSVKDRLIPHVRPDLDKLLRAINDALTGIAFKDDAQVTKIIATKRYTEEEVGCLISVSEDGLYIVQ
jgi:Holliday junction resolvase RusA-like endonuclease